MKPPSILFLVLFSIVVGSIAQAKSWCYVDHLSQSSFPYDSLRQVLEEIYDTDQGIREKIHSAPQDQMGRLFFQMQQIDSVNQAQVKNILNTYGWLPQSKVGEKASDAIFYVIQHADIELIRQYLPFLKKMAELKEAKMTHAAMMEDRLLVNDGKKQIYGTQASPHLREDRKYAIWPVENPSKVNQLRKKAGFETTIEQNAKRLDAIYDPNQKLPQEMKK